MLAGLLAGHEGELGIERLAVNGEVYYSKPGEQPYLSAYAGRFHEVALGINLGDVGHRHGQVGF
jgi:hypothetical protein